MQRHSPPTDDVRWIEASGLRARAITYQYRYCSNCRREWPAKHSSCPTCIRWLGDRPLERTEWQIVPVRGELSENAAYELIGANAVVLRIVSEHLSNDTLAAVAGGLDEALRPIDDGAICAVLEQGWLVWTAGGLRRAFLQGLEIERRLIAILHRLEAGLRDISPFRWGIWIDQYVVPFGRNATPVISDVTATAIFNFAPDNLLLCSEPIFEANRPWEHFVCIPRRLLNDDERYGYRLLGHKRPSALDHAKAADVSAFVGRDEELAFLDVCYGQSRDRLIRAALIADAGSGKTRLVKEWQRQHPERRVLAANFSLFGGGVVSFAGQLAELPPDQITTEALLTSVLARVQAEHIDVLVLDDLHWADSESTAFIDRLLDALSRKAILAILMTRSSGRAVIESLKPEAKLDLRPLPSLVAQDLARQLTGSECTAAIAAQRSKGNPLFVEQFAAWAAETDYQGTGDAPQNLHQVIAARITHLSQVRLASIRQRQRWGSSWEREAIEQELDKLEGEIGLWLDRLETGDYGDQVEVSHYLVNLERVDFEIFLASALAGKPRTRSSRLREAIERLLVGSADRILADLMNRAVGANDAQSANIRQEAQRAGDAVARRYNWCLAAEFYELVLTLAEPRQREDIAHRLAEYRRRGSQMPVEILTAIEASDLEKYPAVDALRLPEIWAQLGQRYGSTKYYGRAASAADAINDRMLAEWANRRATQPKES